MKNDFIISGNWIFPSIHYMLMEMGGPFMPALVWSVDLMNELPGVLREAAYDG